MDFSPERRRWGWLKKAGKGIKKGLKKAGKGMKKGLKKAGKGVKKGLKKAGKRIKGLKRKLKKWSGFKVGRKFKKGWRKFKSSQKFRKCKAQCLAKSVNSPTPSRFMKGCFTKCVRRSN